jgi:hypothetical protein
MPEAPLRAGAPSIASPPLRLVPVAPDSAPPPAGPRPGAPPTPVPRLEIPPYDLRAALELERELGVSHVLAQVLIRRGFDQADAARAFLDAEERHDASAFDGIETAVASIRGHIDAGSRIVVHGDYDVDGVCATAVLVRALR